MSLPNDTSRCTGRFDTVPGQLGAQLHGHCVGCLRMTSPPAREPLSDAEIDAIMTPLTQNVEYSWRKFARAIEAALRAKP